MSEARPGRAALSSAEVRFLEIMNWVRNIVYYGRDLKQQGLISRMPGAIPEAMKQTVPKQAADEVQKRNVSAAINGKVKHFGLLILPLTFIFHFDETQIFVYCQID